jgi:hypothetical protein
LGAIPLTDSSSPDPASILLCGIDSLYVARREHSKIITAPVSATIGDRELERGIDILAAAVKVTLGPKGRIL